MTPLTKMTPEQVASDLKEREVAPVFRAKKTVELEHRVNRDLAHAGVPVAITEREPGHIAQVLAVVGSFRKPAKHRARTAPEKRRRRAHQARLRATTMRSLTCHIQGRSSSDRWAS